MKTPRHTTHLNSLPELAERLRRHSLKFTAPRQSVLRILQQHKHPLSIKEIYEAVPAGDCDLATIYRAMHLLEEMRMVKRFDFGDGVARFELLCEGDDGHHHHLVCTKCSEIVEIEECFGREFEERIATQSGFKAITHKLEFFGLCPECQR